MTALVVFAGGLLTLLASAFLVVRAASDLGKRLGLTPMVIGLTIVAAGTSVPELAVVGQAIAAEDTELAVGSIVGSNIANILLVLGIAATLGTIHVASRVVRTDIPVMIAASTLLLILAIDGVLGRLDSLVLFAGLIGFVTWTLRTTQRNRPTKIDDARPLKPAMSIPRAGAELVAGLALSALAARMVVGGAEDIAVSLGVPELIIGLTIVALGTSAPEIVTTLVAARQGRYDFAVGNAVGSNIFNILFVLGATGLVAPSGITVSDEVLRLDLPILVAVAIACLPVVSWDHKLSRWEGAMFVAYYGAYVTFLVLDSTGHRAADPFALVMIAFVLPLTVITLATAVYRQRHHRRPDGQGASTD